MFDSPRRYQGYVAVPTPQNWGFWGRTNAARSIRSDTNGRYHTKVSAAADRERTFTTAVLKKLTLSVSPPCSTLSASALSPETSLLESVLPESSESTSVVCTSASLIATASSSASSAAFALIAA